MQRTPFHATTDGNILPGSCSKHQKHLTVIWNKQANKERLMESLDSFQYSWGLDPPRNNFWEYDLYWWGQENAPLTGQNTCFWISDAKGSLNKSILLLVFFIMIFVYKSYSDRKSHLVIQFGSYVYYLLPGSRSWILYDSDNLTWTHLDLVTGFWNSLAFAFWSTKHEKWWHKIMATQSVVQLMRWQIITTKKY